MTAKQPPSKRNPADHLAPYQYKKGQSGNPSGRKKGSRSLKEYAKEMLLGMSNEEREKFLHGINKKDIWEMAEGKASQGIGQAEDLGKLTVQVISFDDYNHDSPQPEAE